MVSAGTENSENIAKGGIKTRAVRMPTTIEGRLPWADRFRRPAAAQLSEHYDKAVGRLFTTAREKLISFSGAKEEMEWHGVPWRWTLVYRCPGDPTKALAYLAPTIGHPQIAVPLTEEIAKGLPTDRIKKFIRDGIENGRHVGTMIWASWEIGGLPELEAVMDLVKRKHNAFTKAHPGAGSGATAR